MINVNGLKRNAKNIVKKYSDAQIKVREATSNDPWGPSSTIMSEIADLTYNVVAFSEIMQMIWKRLNDNDKNWRHVYKALVLLEYLIKTGTEKVAQQCIENIFAIQTLKDFQYMDENRDYGVNIREKSKKLVALLKDSEKLKTERARALKAKARLAESMSNVGKTSLLSSIMSGSMGDTTTNSGTSSNGNNNLNYHNNSRGSTSLAHYLQDSGSSGLLNYDLDSARPQTATEEENQLKLALALSKEEAEQQEKTRKNDELRLKLALDVSKKTASSSILDDFNEPSTSASGLGISSSTLPNSSNSSVTTSSGGPATSTIDDLLGLTIPPPSDSISNTKATSSSPFSTLMNANRGQQSTLGISSVTSAFPEPQNDPWSVDPWSTTGSAAISSQVPLKTVDLQSASSLSATSKTQQPVTAFNDLITTAMQSMPHNQIGSTTLLGHGNQTSSVPLNAALNSPLTSTTHLTSNNIFSNPGSTTNIAATTASKRPMSSKNPFQD